MIKVIDIRGQAMLVNEKNIIKIEKYGKLCLISMIDGSAIESSSSIDKIIEILNVMESDGNKR